MEEQVATNRVDTDNLKSEVEVVRGEIVDLKLALEVHKKKAASMCVREISERFNKLRNIIIFNLNEANETDAKERDKADGIITHEFPSSLSTEFATITFTHSRVGKNLPKVGGKPRPLQVTLPTQTDASSARKLFISQFKTKQPLPQFNKVNISQDKTLAKQQEFKALKLEMTERALREGKAYFIGERNGILKILEKKVHQAGE